MSIYKNISKSPIIFQLKGKGSVRLEVGANSEDLPVGVDNSIFIKALVSGRKLRIVKTTSGGSSSLGEIQAEADAKAKTKAEVKAKAEADAKKNSRR